MRVRKLIASLLAMLLAVPMFSYNKSVSAATAGVEIDSTNFPDAAFREAIRNQGDTDGNGYLSDAEISNLTTLYISKNLKLEHLECTFLPRNMATVLE